jgi:hypothetical protein
VYDLCVRWAWLLVLVAAGAVLFWLGGRSGAPPGPPASKPALPAKAEFVGSAACLPCHAAEHEGWLKTAHANTLRPADTVAGAFDGTRVGDTTPERAGGDLLMRVEPPGRGIPGNHKVTWVLGKSTEFYLTTDAVGAWRLLPIAWDTGRKAWEQTTDVYGPLVGDPAPGDARQIVVNRDCAWCHATGFDPGFHPEPQGDGFDSKMGEGGIGCEACHGPGSVHVLWHEEKRSGAYAPPARLSKGAPGACLRCHVAEEARFAMPFDPDVPREDFVVTRDFDGFGFLPDGRLSAARHAGTTFLDSKCAKGGATCLSCHAPHGGMTAEGDALCTKCHDGFAKREHTFHEDVRCVDCHMPRLLAAPLDRMRDHALRSPDPVLTERYEVPNACGTCHGDKPAAWAREWREKWWGPTDERVVRDVALVAGLRKGAVAPERLAETARDPRSPLFFRATALRALPAGHEALRDALSFPEVDLLEVACEALAERGDPHAARGLLPLLGHPARTVRIEAAYALSRMGWRPTEPQPRIHDDVVMLLVRQCPTMPLLLRSAWIADALGGSNEMSYLLPVIAQRAPADAAPLIERRGRALAEEGQHALALQAYGDARRIYGNDPPPMLHIDFADSLAASGESESAKAAWREAMKASDPASVAYAIGKARLLGVDGAAAEGKALLEGVAARLVDDPVGGEDLLRVRWSIHQLTR